MEKYKNSRISKDSKNTDEVEIEYIESVEVKKRYSPKAIKNEIKYLNESIEKFEERKANLENQLQEVEEEIIKLKNAKK